MKQTSLAQGDFSRTSSSWANQTRMLSENWKEFLGILGSGLIQILTPVVQILNELLKGLIGIAKTIGYVIKLLSGKGADSTKDAADATGELGTSADGAADSENNLAGGINNAAKAAQNALAKFDQLDVLQQSVGSGGGGGDFDIGDMDFDLDVDDPEKDIDDLENRIDKFLVGLKEKLHEFATEPVLVFDPVFAPIPDPVYKPDWGLNPNPVLEPAFEPILDPVYNPSWGLNPNPVPSPVFPLLPNPVYDPSWGLNEALSAEMGLVYGDINEFETNLGISCAEVESTFNHAVEEILNGFTMMAPAPDEFALNFGIASEDVQMSLSNLSESFATNLRESYETTKAFETNFGISAENVVKAFQGEENAIDLGTDNMIKNLQTLRETAIRSTSEWVLSTAKDFENWKASVTSSIYKTADYLITNINSALTTASQNVVTWANNTSENFITWGNSILDTAWESAKGFASNFIAGLRNAWESFKSFIDATGETLSGFWNENKDWIKPTLTITGLVAAGAAVVLSGGTLAAPLAAGAAMIPALATGAVIPPNQQFMAILGDQKSGRNLEAPESLIRQIMKEELAGLSSGGDMTVDMPVYLDGEVIYRNQKKVSRRHGTKLVTGGI